LRASLDLRAADLGGVLEAVGDDELLELSRPDDVRPLADEDRPVVVAGVEDVDAADRLRLLARRRARRPALRQPRDGPDVLGRGAAAAADEIDPALFH